MAQSAPGYSYNRMTREDYKKKKELEEARKAGNAPAEKDEEGRDINPHIPQYMTKVPWYQDSLQKPSLKHQRYKPKEKKPKKWYKRGKKGAKATKWVKGACENCGARTHNTKDCFERPRRKKVKFNNSNIVADDVLLDEPIDFDYDTQRDRWNGVDINQHSKLVDAKFKLLEAERKRIKKEKTLKEMEESKNKKKEEKQQDSNGSNKKKSILDEYDSSDSEGDSDYELEEDDDIKLTGDEGLHIKIAGNKRSRTTVRNLRIREDTPKYLLNLDLNSAHYDPKSRSMRSNPLPNKDPNEISHPGENFIRRTGDTNSFKETQRFAWEASKKGQNVHFQSAPTQIALGYQEFKEKKEKLVSRQDNLIIEKYGVSKSKKLPKALIFGQTEEFVEYKPDGSLLKGKEMSVKSRWEEDVYINNHKSVWGSFWQQGKWGYKCCHSFIKNSYCAGQIGIDTLREQNQKQQLIHENNNNEDNDESINNNNNDNNINEHEDHDDKQMSLVDLMSKNNKKKSKKLSKQELKEQALLKEKEKEIKLKSALKKERNRVYSDDKDDSNTNPFQRKKKYNSLSKDSYDVSDEEYQAYLMTKKASEDPMYEYLKNKNKK